jgi:hypothetical protein
MTGDTRAQVAAIAKAVQFHSATSFTFASGPLIHVTAVEAGFNEAGAVDGSAVAPLASALANTLYSQCYARDFDGVSFRPSPNATEVDSDFAIRLAQSNHSRYGWDPQWQIYRLGVDGEIQVKKGDRHRSPLPGEYAFGAGPGIRAQVGDVVSLQVLRESHDVQPGMYYVFGETLGDQFDEFNLVRFYFHIVADAAPNLIDWLTTQLNRFQVSFQLKCQKRPVLYDRLDAFVVYVARRHFGITARVIAAVPGSVLAGLKPGIPLFTHQLREGIGVAEDPGDRRSFGLNRCQLLAQGIVTAWTNGQSGPDAQLDAVRRCFAAKQLDFDRPHLNAGSADLEPAIFVGVDL